VVLPLDSFIACFLLDFSRRRHFSVFSTTGLSSSFFILLGVFAIRQKPGTSPNMFIFTPRLPRVGRVFAILNISPTCKSSSDGVMYCARCFSEHSKPNMSTILDLSPVRFSPIFSRSMYSESDSPSSRRVE